MIHVRVANIRDDVLDNMGPRRRRYYENKAWKVARILNHRIVQSFLKDVIRSERISRNSIRDIRVMILPSLRDPEYGEHLFGLYDSDEGQISIYPAVKYKGLKFLTDPMVSFQFIKESIDTLIHEVLHAKYKNESTVRKLTHEYLEKFYRMLKEYLD